jgi:hypothetical protein
MSSEQILHPEKFWDPAKRDLPKGVSVPEVKGVLGHEWRREGSGVLGELGLAVLTGLDPPSAAAGLEAADASAWTNAAASGWGGDRWELWSDGERRVVTLVTVWDTGPDAKEFALALPERPGMGWKREGRRVALVAGETAGRSVALLERLLR